MKFHVYPLMWGHPSGLQPEDVIKEAKISYTWNPPKGECAGYLEVDITPEQLAKLVQDERIDVMISGEMLAFDVANGMFRQR